MVPPPLIPHSYRVEKWGFHLERYLAILKGTLTCPHMCQVTRQGMWEMYLKLRPYKQFCNFIHYYLWNNSNWMLLSVPSNTSVYLLKRFLCHFMTLVEAYSPLLSHVIIPILGPSHTLSDFLRKGGSLSAFRLFRESSI